MLKVEIVLVMHINILLIPLIVVLVECLLVLSVVLGGCVVVVV